MFLLSYTLEDHGWATASFGNGESTIQTDVSYLSDALGDLARAARGILRGLPQATFSLQREPGEHRIVFTRRDDHVTVNVYAYPDTFSGSEYGDLLLTAECPVRTFATACINCLR